jgi:hypothetical protein
MQSQYRSDGGVCALSEDGDCSLKEAEELRLVWLWQSQGQEWQSVSRKRKPRVDELTAGLRGRETRLSLWLRFQLDQKHVLAIHPPG